MIDEIEDIEFERLLADKKHKELMTAIKQLIISIKNDDTKDAEILNSINSNNKALNIFLSKLNELVKPEKDAVINVETNQDEVVREAKIIADNQLKIISLLEKRPTRLKVVRGGYENLIQFVDVSYGEITKDKILNKSNNH